MTKINLKTLFIALTILSVPAFAQLETSTIGSAPGAFSRLGFGARGMAMGNAMSSVITGEKTAYYNPALASFQEGNSFQTSYSFLSLDRSLNFLSFTRNFKMGVKQNPDGSYTKPRSVAGVSGGIINAGVSGIDARDNQGIIFDELSTSENQFFIAVSNKFSEHFAIGLRFNFYYYSLYEEVSASAVGLDLGLIYILNDNFSFSFVLQNLNSEYKWDTTPVYGQSGANTIEKFPTIKKLGATYYLKDPNLLVSVEWEGSNMGTNYIRLGAEYEVFENLFLRGGFDRWNLSNADEPMRPALGFSYARPFGSTVIGFDYAFVVEPYSDYASHIIGLNFNF